MKTELTREEIEKAKNNLVIKNKQLQDQKDIKK